jgi:O-succinylbenzoic acid--CoA ligase
VDAIRRVWDDGDAIAPIDPRLPQSEVDRVLDVLRPGALMEADGRLRPLPDGLAVADGDALVIATSGTSGRPKGVIHTHASVDASARATSAALDVDPERDKWLACLPLAHIGGLAVVMRSIVTGTPVEVHERFDPEATMDAASRGATLVSLVTRALNQIDPARFRTILVGGGAPPPDRPPNVRATYGMTETGSGVVYDDTMLEGLELTIGPPDRPAPTGEAGPQGEIHLRGPMLFRGYRGLSDDEQPFVADRWFPTGDLGSLTGDGALTVHGREGDMIATGGENVWPEPIERVLLARPDVAQAAVIGRPDPEWGHRVVAVVVPADRSNPPSLDELRATVTEVMPTWAAPKELELVEDLPRTSLGKIRRNLL